MAAFSEMGVMPEIAQAVEEMDWLLPTDIQAESIPLILGGGDVLMAAETGSGKTGAFSIPVIQIVYETLKDQQEGKKGKTTIKTGASVLNKWQMNPYDRGSAFAIGSDGLCCQSREVKEWHGCRGTRGLLKGKHQFSCVCLHGDRKPHERKQNLERFKKGDVRFLICTDVAARGIDIHGVPYVINVTLPDEKQNYVHRIGRVGRAERMGLAISLVATEKEKVWYHVCSNRGKGCYNTRLKEDGGCTIWYNEMQLLSEIEEHLNCTISQVEPDIKVPVDEFDGKVM